MKNRKKIIIMSDTVNIIMIISLEHSLLLYALHPLKAEYPLRPLEVVHIVPQIHE